MEIGMSAVGNIFLAIIFSYSTALTSLASEGQAESARDSESIKTTQKSA